MTIKERIVAIRLSEKIEHMTEYANKIGLSVESNEKENDVCKLKGGDVVKCECH